MGRIINDIEKINSYATWRFGRKLHITFASQQLFDLWINEMHGQISDGLWENSRGTEWLWNAEIHYSIGEKTSVKYYGYTSAHKRCFKWCKDLEAIQERAVEESGFASVQDMKKAWNEIADAIHEAEWSNL